MSACRKRPVTARYGAIAPVAETAEPAGHRPAGDAGIPCPGCRAELAPHGTYCVECGLCVLGVTASGTVVADLAELEAAARPTPPDAIRFDETGAIIIEDDEIVVVEDEFADDEFEVDIVAGEPTLEDDALDVLLAAEISEADILVIEDLSAELPPREHTVLSPAPTRPRPYWPAPERGETVVAFRPPALRPLESSAPAGPAAASV